MSHTWYSGCLSLNTLVLNNCSLGSSSVAHLAQASKQGRLPQLKHLDLYNRNLSCSELAGLFYGSCSWNELITLVIRNNCYLGSDFRIDFMKMAQIKGSLGSLQELGIDRYTPGNVVWSCLKALYLSSCTKDELRNISDAIDQGCFPALRTLCVENFEGYDMLVP